MTALFIITSKNKMPQLLNWRHLVFPAPEGQLSAHSGGRAKVRRICQSTLMGGVCTQLRHFDRNL